MLFHIPFADTPLGEVSTWIQLAGNAGLAGFAYYLLRYTIPSMQESFSKSSREQQDSFSKSLKEQQDLFERRMSGAETTFREQNNGLMAWMMKQEEHCANDRKQFADKIGQLNETLGRAINKIEENNG
jgi:hypothetical protein